jgi:hypothetical protein
VVFLFILLSQDCSCSWWFTVCPTDAALATVTEVTDVFSVGLVLNLDSEKEFSPFLIRFHVGSDVHDLSLGSFFLTATVLNQEPSLMADAAFMIFMRILVRSIPRGMAMPR